MTRQKKLLKILSRIGILLFVLIVVGLIFPIWTPKIEEENSISELRMVGIDV